MNAYLMTRYELTFLLKDEEEVKSLSKLLESFSGKLIEEKKWGKRQLAYPIKKDTSASYFTWKIDLENKNSEEFKKKLNFNEKLMRYLLLES